MLLMPLISLAQTTTAIYSSEDNQSIWAAFVVKDKYPTADLIDISDIDSLEVDTLLMAITDTSQLNIYVTVPVTAGGVSAGELSEAQITYLETYKVYMGTDTGVVYQTGNTVSPVKTASRQTWEAIYMTPSGVQCEPALFLSLLGGYKIGLINYQTATSYTDTSITKSGAGWTTNAYAGKYVYIASATTGKGVYAKVKSNNATRLIVYASNTTWYEPTVSPYAISATSGGFRPSITGTCIFSVVDDYHKVFLPMYALRFAECYLKNPENSYQMDWFQKLCNLNGKAAQCKAAPYDKDSFNKAMQYGKIVFDNEIVNP